MSKHKKDGFTLVELLAVIVILAVILVIAVPSIISTITESRKGALASSAKLIASSAETAYISNQTLGIEKTLTCQDVSNYNETEDYTCDLQIEDGKAKVTLIGKGKFEGMAVCGGTKEEAEVEEPINGKCPTPFEKDNWATIKAAVDAEKAGEVGATSKYKVGDTRPIDLDIDGDGEDETYTLRIANKSTPTECGQTGFSQTACGFVIEFADIISEKPMNSNDKNVGGWERSTMRTYVNGTIYKALVAAIGDTDKDRPMIIDTIVVSGHGRSDTTNYTTTDKLYLLSTREVWGTKLDFDTVGVETITRQLDYYKNNNVSTSSYSGAIKQNAGTNSFWWLRSASSNSSYRFYYVNNDGSNLDIGAGSTYGVSPAFRLG